MKKSISLIFLLHLLWLGGYSQIDRYNDQFYPGYYITQDSNEVHGLIKVYLANDKLQYKENEGAQAVKVPAKEILGFVIDTSVFHTFDDIKLYGAYGIVMTMPSVFGQLEEEGEIDAYSIILASFDGALYLNCCIIKPNGEKLTIPVYQRLKKKRVEKNKDELSQFFNQDPEWCRAIDELRREDGFGEVLLLIRDYNSSHL